MAGDWMEVSKDKPCTACGHSRRCTVAPDGNAIVCRHVADPPPGWRLGKRHPDGSATLHRDDGSKKPRRRTKRKSATSVRTAAGSSGDLPSAESRDRFYRALLGRLSLTTLHRLALKDRGLSNDEIDRRGYKSMQSPQGRTRVAAELQEEFGDLFFDMPGAGIKDGKPRLFGASGLAIPVRDADGLIIAVLIRNDRSTDSKYTFLSSRKFGGNGPAARRMCR